MVVVGVVVAADSWWRQQVHGGGGCGGGCGGGGKFVVVVGVMVVGVVVGVGWIMKKKMKIIFSLFLIYGYFRNFLVYLHIYLLKKYLTSIYTYSTPKTH